MSSNSAGNGSAVRKTEDTEPFERSNRAIVVGTVLVVLHAVSLAAALSFF